MTEPDAAVAIVHTGGADESVLLMRRAEREDDSWSGHWSFPGGRREPTDYDLLQTALRELEEECGVRLRREDLETELPPRYARRRAGAYVSVTPFLFRSDGELPVILDEREAAEGVWIPLSIFRNPARHLLLPIPGLPEELRFPGIALNGGPLWGFTYRLICDWLSLGPPHDQEEQVGFQAARDALDFLLSYGLTLQREWTGQDDAVRTAHVAGPIPVAAVLDRFGGPGGHVLAVNCLEVRPDRIRVVGPRFEEYFIRASG